MDIGNKFLSASERKFTVVEVGDQWLEVSIIAPKFIIDIVREVIPPCFRGICCWPTTDRDKIRAFVPSPDYPATKHGKFLAMRAFEEAVESTVRSWALYCSVRAEIPHESCSTLAPMQNIYNLWRFECRKGEFLGLHRDVSSILCGCCSETEKEYVEWIEEATREYAEGELGAA